MSNLTIPKSSPVLVGNLSAGYLHTGDLFVQVFPWINPQVPVKVLVLMLSPTSSSSGSLAFFFPFPCTQDFPTAALSCATPAGATFPCTKDT